MSFHQIPLRDWFAGMAMQAFLSTRPVKTSELDFVVIDAYAVADEMMRARDEDAPTIVGSKETP